MKIWGSACDSAVTAPGGRGSLPSLSESLGESLRDRRGSVPTACRGFILLAAVGAFLFAQETISTDVNVVNVFATVHDKKGAIVKDLTKDDFAIDEDGRPQTIKYFSRESDLPLTLGLVVDTSRSMASVLDQERIASYRFFDQVLREDKDQAFVIHFDAEVELLQDLTSSRKLLQKALGELSVGAPRQLNRRGQQDPGQPRARGGTSLYDAVLLASNELMKKQTGRKALIVLTDGDDNASKSTLTDAIEAAQKTNTLVYSVLITGENNSPMGGFGGRGMGRHGGGRPPMQQHHDGRKVLEQLSRETGGGFFDAKKMSYDGIYREIQDELREQYSLGYTPDKNQGPGYRTISVMTKKKDLIVQARNGYYAEK